jgi:hypothetical protein
MTQDCVTTKKVQCLSVNHNTRCSGCFGSTAHLVSAKSEKVKSHKHMVFSLMIIPVWLNLLPPMSHLSSHRVTPRVHSPHPTPSPQPLIQYNHLQFPPQQPLIIPLPIPLPLQQVLPTSSPPPLIQDPLNHMLLMVINKVTYWHTTLDCITTRHLVREMLVSKRGCQGFGTQCDPGSKKTQKNHNDIHEIL